MFGIGMPEMAVILVIALVVIGPGKLPELARSLGKGLAEFKKVSEDFQRNIHEEARKADEGEREVQAQASATGSASSPSAETGRDAGNNKTAPPA